MAARKKLPTALVKNAAKTATAAKAKALAKARTDLRLILRKRVEIADAFYEIGEALARLRAQKAHALFGFGTFVDFCEQRLDLSRATVDRLIGIATRIRRDDAVQWGQDKSVALLELADATAADDTPRQVAKTPLVLPGGKKLDVEKASASKIEAIAKQLRAKHGKGSVRGRTTTREERDLAATLQKKLVAAHLEASVVAVATKPGDVSKLRIELPADALDTLRVALRGL